MKKLNTIKEAIIMINGRKNSGIYSIYSGGIDAVLATPLLYKGIFFNIEIMAYAIDKERWNLTPSSDKYLGDIPNINDTFKLYYNLKGNIKYVNVKRISEKVFEVIE